MTPNTDKHWRFLAFRSGVIIRPWDYSAVELVAWLWCFSRLESADHGSPSLGWEKCSKSGGRMENQRLMVGGYSITYRIAPMVESGSAWWKNLQRHARNISVLIYPPIILENRTTFTARESWFPILLHYEFVTIHANKLCGWDGPITLRPTLPLSSMYRRQV